MMLLLYQKLDSDIQRSDNDGPEWNEVSMFDDELEIKASDQPSVLTATEVSKNLTNKIQMYEMEETKF